MILWYPINKNDQYNLLSIKYWKTIFNKYSLIRNNQYKTFINKISKNYFQQIFIDKN